MAAAVPFALLGIVQLGSVAVWLGLAAAACFPQLRRRATPLVVVGALAVAGTEAATALQFGHATSDLLGAIRLVALVLLAVALADGVYQPRSVLPSVLVPLADRVWLAVAGAVAAGLASLAAIRRTRNGDRVVGLALAAGLTFTAAAAGLAGWAQHYDVALGVLAARGAAALCFVVVLVQLARSNLLGKLVGAIGAGVVAMAIGAVAVVGVGVADQVQHDQSMRLLSVAQAQQASLGSLAARAGLFAKVVALCPQNPRDCTQLLKLFATDPDYFAVLDPRGSTPAVVAPSRHALSNAALIQLAGSPVVRTALQRSSTPQTVASGAVVLAGSPARLAVVAAVPGRPGNNARLRPSFAAVYGIGVVNSYLTTVRSSIGYDVSVLVDGQVIASDLTTSARSSIVAESRAADIDQLGPSATAVVPAEGDAPTVAFVPVTAAGNDDQRIATLAVSQPASVALAAQRSVLRRLVFTALVVLVIVAVLALLLAQRIAEPVRRLTVAAGRVRRGDLSARAGVDSRDEVGQLARSFDAMTDSLHDMTVELRDAAAAEAALRSRLETVVGSMNDGLIVTDAAGVVTSANPTAAMLLARDDVVGRPVSELAMRAPDGASLLERVDGRGSVEGVIGHDDGTEVPVRAAVAPLADGQGQVVVLADRTREREVERLKTEFLANVSHELRTPLTPIRGYAELLARHQQLSAQQIADFVTEILSSTARMHRVVELLVDVAALDAGRVTPLRRTVRVAAFADERLSEWRDRYPERAGDLRRRIAARLPALDVDPVWLAKACNELADNAVKYTPAGTPITFAAAAGPKGYVQLAVRDAGDGVDLSRIGELFGDFAQADASETRGVGGLGLGLGFVARVADQLGLALHVSSDAGKGSEFALDVPADSAGSRPARGRRPRR